MLELNAKPKEAPAGALVTDGSDATFMSDVIDASREVPVIVDFWAPWCGPCKQLGPALEAAVQAARGKVRMVKINVDENPGIAGQLRIQSIPTVYAFFDGKPVDGFQGALPASEVNKFVSKLSEMGGDDGGLGAALEAAETMLAEGAAVDAAETFAAILEQEPANAAAYSGLVRAELAGGSLEQAEALLKGVPAEIATAKEIEAARAAVDLARQAEAAGPADALRAAVAADPSDSQARYDLALALHAQGLVEEAVDELLELFRRDREWNEGAAKVQLLKIFDTLKPQDPLGQRGRRRLSSMIFA
ncbi:thioredoxin family protein [Solirhodobacter olei]|uniref:thioredoxin family protein n=1 Tax=Solirhodobacter olei TaxID=2493082 RepID=UPI000FDB507C|nr:co-chaperone YbbN [Solirhodobacter olei]